MHSFRNGLVALRLHKAWTWIGVLIYATAVTFPHQPVQDFVGQLARQFTLRSVYRGSVTMAAIEALVLTFLFLKSVRAQASRRTLVILWTISFALMIGTWRMFTANNTELVHYPQYFVEGVVLLALTRSPVESLAWITVFGGLDEAFQYTYLVAGRAVPYDFNDVYMDLAGGAAGVVFAIAVIGWKRRAAFRVDLVRILRKPGIALLLGIVTSGIILWGTGRMLLYEAEGSPSHWFSLSRLQTPTFWYFSPVVLGPHHFHELAPVEGTILILATVALSAMLDWTFIISAELSASAPKEMARRTTEHA
jgi:hypothetical protein